MLLAVACLYLKERWSEEQLLKQVKIEKTDWYNALLIKQNAWYAEESARIVRERETNFTEAQQQIVEQTERRFQQPVLTTYRLAQYLEANARKVVLPNEPSAWEIALTGKQGLIKHHYDYEARGLILRLYFRNEPDRLALSTTAPSADATNAKSIFKSR